MKCNYDSRGQVNYDRNTFTVKAAGLSSLDCFQTDRSLRAALLVSRSAVNAQKCDTGSFKLTTQIDRPVVNETAWTHFKQETLIQYG